MSNTAPESMPSTGGKGGIGLFLRQVAAELRKVVRPTRQELVSYTWAVLIFVMIMMAFVSALDAGFGQLMMWALGSN